MLRSILLAAALISATAPAFADNGRGRGGDRHHDNRGDRGDRGRNDHRDNNRNNNRNWDRGRDNNWNNNRNWNNNWNHNNNYYRDNHRSRSNLSLSLGVLLGSPSYTSYDRYDDYGYAGGYSGGWELYPGQCRWDREFAYWRGRPADVEVKRCADRYGSIYIVAGAQRLWRYR